ncbi:MAG: PIN domain-containing protein [Bacillota bacterium]
MILVDTSVIISYLKGKEGCKVSLLEEILDRDIPYGISSLTYQEVLQGAKDENEWKNLQGYLSTQKIYYPEPVLDTYEKAARLLFDLRRQGITPRSSIDIIIVLTALEHGLALLHDDRDFDMIDEHVSGLRILERF